MFMNPTIHDVARLADTSKSTVSRYLNGGKVKKKTQEALELAIKELKYHRNANARNLVMNKTNTIAVIVDSISNNFYSQIIAGIEHVAGQFGYNCVFLSWTSNIQYDSETSFLKLVLEGKADGIILVSFKKRTEEELLVFKQCSYPVVLVGDNGGMSGIQCVDVDNSTGVAEMVKYLHRIGHSKIAYISGPSEAAATKHRFRGYMEAMKSLQMDMNPEWIIDSDWSNRGGSLAMEKLLQQGGFTSVIASNDETAIGALSALQQRGFHVPRDFSMAGFDDIAIASWVYPSLTTVRQPFWKIGACAAQHLLEMLSNKSHEYQLTLLKPELIIRDSCGKI
jgi:DNA-binding LacI/PurR family transcriptional regulator